MSWCVSLHSFPEDSKLRLCRHFDRQRKCCVRPGMCQTLKDQGVRMETPSNQEWVYGYACSISTSISDTERLHATTKRYNANLGLDFHKISAFGFNRAARSSFACARPSTKPRSRSVPTSATPHPSAVAYAPGAGTCTLHILLL